MTSVMTFDSVQLREVGRLDAAPLRLALVQTRTVPILAIETPAEVQRLVDELDGAWTVTDRQTNRELAVQFGPGGVQQQAGTPETVWVLTSIDGTTRAALSATSVTVETDRYERWEGFRAAVRAVFAAVQATFAPARSTRLGVRYINQLDDERASGDPAALAELLNPALIAPVLALERPLLGSLGEVRVDESDDAVLVLRHGLVARGSYLLDLDAFREVSEPFDAAGLAARTEVFHTRIESIFAWALNDDYLNELGGNGSAVQVRR